MTAIEEAGVEPAQAIYSAMLGNDTWTKATGEHRHPLWVGEMVSSIVLGTGLEPIEYVTLNDQRPLQGYAFTESFVAVVDAAPGDELVDEVDWSVQIRALKTLSHIEVRASVGPFDQRMTGAHWPGSPSAVLHFEDREPLRIPFTRPFNSQDRDQLVATVRRLPGFLR